MNEEETSTATAPPNMRKVEVATWLGMVMRRSSQVARVDLCKVPSSDPIMTWACAGGAENPEVVTELAGEMVEMAESHGKSYNAAGGAAGIAYRLRAVDGNGVQCSEKPLMVPGNPTKGGATELPDLVAALGMTMKMNNELGTVLIRAFAGRDEAWTKQNELLLKQNIELREAHYKTLQQQQRFMLFEVEQRRMGASLAREEKKDEWLMENLGTLLPLIANRLAGGGPGKGAPAIEQLLGSLFEKFTPEQIEMFMGPMSPLDDASKMLFGELYQSLMKRKVTMLNARRAGVAEDLAHANGVTGKDPPS